MKTHLLGFLVIVLAMVTAVTGGCVSNDKYQEALSACRRADDQLKVTQETLDAIKEENEKLADDLRTRDAELLRKQDEITLLDDDRTSLNDSLQKARDTIRKMLEADRPTPIGDIIVPAPVDEALRTLAAANSQLVDYLPKYGMLKFKTDLTFDPGKDDVSTVAQDALAKFVQIINSQEASRFHVYVAGHTDDIPILKPATRRRHPNNTYLSVHRAVEVQKALKNAGLAPERIGVMGFGQYHPTVPNAPNQKGNKLNRRVEIWIIPPDRFLTKSTGAPPDVPKDITK